MTDGTTENEGFPAQPGEAPRPLSDLVDRLRDENGNPVDLPQGDINNPIAEPLREATADDRPDDNPLADDKPKAKRSRGKKSQAAE